MTTGPYSYPYCDFDFAEWNPVQARCVGHFTEDCNLVVSASTASGKTVIAEAISGYELSRGKKVVYVSPLKAIGQEKFREWSRGGRFHLGKEAFLLVSSDNKVKLPLFEKASVIVSTIESMDLRCRAKDRWLEEVGVLVFDEAHMIGDESRGCGGESLIMNITQLNPSCRVVCLSGTMSNYREIAKWLKSCNGKSTYYVNSSWRPTKLEKSVIVAEGFEEQSSRLKEALCEDEQSSLVFVHSKSTGERLLKFLKGNGVRCAFYHAGLRKSVRTKMLGDFRHGAFNTMICTSSLSMGISI